MDNTATFTPGPWEIDLTGECGDSDISICMRYPSGNPHYTVSVYGNGPLTKRTKETMANARLVAKAPEMYSLLRQLIDIEGPQPGNVEWFHRVKSVLHAVDGTD